MLLSLRKEDELLRPGVRYAVLSTFVLPQLPQVKCQSYRVHLVSESMRLLKYARVYPRAAKLLPTTISVIVCRFVLHNHSLTCLANLRECIRQGKLDPLRKVLSKLQDLLKRDRAHLEPAFWRNISLPISPRSQIQQKRDVQCAISGSAQV